MNNLILKIDNRNSNNVLELLKRKPYNFITSYTEFNPRNGITRVIDIFSTHYNKNYVKQILIKNGYVVSSHSIRNELKISVRANESRMYHKQPQKQWQNKKKNYQNNY